MTNRQSDASLVPASLQAGSTTSPAQEPAVAEHTISCLVAARDICGEGILWRAGEQALYWTDINRALLHRYRLSTQVMNTWSFDQPVTAVTETDDPGRLLVVLGGSVALWSVAEESAATIFHLPDWPRVRCNDARVSPCGSLWLGTMQNNVTSDGETGPVTQDLGELLRLQSGCGAQRFDADFKITNTVAWTPDARSLLFADTLRNLIYKYPYDPETDSVARREIFASGFTRGLPDGSAMDSEGGLWNCRYGGGCIARFLPDGAVERLIEMPVRNPTSCCFGGDSLHTLYVTSARDGVPDPGEMEGGVFAIQLEIAGLPLSRFQLSRRTGNAASSPPSTR